MSKISKYLFLATIYSLIVWSMVPLLRLSLPMDTQEALVWGKYCLWGTTKHPPFSGWLAYDFYRLFGFADWSMYLLSQLCVVVGIFYIYKLARCFLDEIRAGTAVLLQFGIIYYHFSAAEFNVNVLSLALWPMCAYYFWMAYTENRLKNWLLFGFLVGINLLNKYVSLMLLVSLSVFVIADKKVWFILKNRKVYAAAAVALLLFIPHLWWLYGNDFEMLNYISARSRNGGADLYGHIVYPLKFLLAQLLFSAPMLLTFLWLRYKSKTDALESKRSISLFVVITALLPVCLFTITGVISGNALKSMWGFPCLFMWGIALVYFYPLQDNFDVAKKAAKAAVGWISLFAMVYAVQCLFTTSPRFRTDVKDITARLEQKWQERTLRPLVYVASDVWYGDIMALYASHEVKPMIWMNPKNNPWFDENDFRDKGALIVADTEGEYEGYRNMYGADVSEPMKMEVEFKNYFGKTKTKDIVYGFYLP